MILLSDKDCPQGSATWHRHRLGIPTASNFDKVMTTAKRMRSSQAETYKHRLLAEWLTGEPSELAAKQQEFIERGKLLEPKAIEWYELQYDVEVTRVGIALNDDMTAAASPDGLIGDDEGIEIKCPAAHTHVSNILHGHSKYFAQMQGAMWLTGRKRWHLVSFHPSMPCVVKTVERDESYINALARELEAFISEMMSARQALIGYGCEPKPMTLSPSQAEPEPF